MHSWIPAFFDGEGAALPWYENLQPKPAYYAIRDALQVEISAMADGTAGYGPSHELPSRVVAPRHPGAGAPAGGV